MKTSGQGSVWLTGIACSLALTGCGVEPPHQGTLVAVRRVVSGQTLAVVAVDRQLSTTEYVRLIGISAPDLKQEPWGAQAKRQLEQMLTDDPVLLETGPQPVDRFGRRLAYVWQGQRLLNEALVATGHALAAPRSPHARYAERLTRAQERARLLGFGIWNPQQPLRQTPAEFRRQVQSPHD